MRFILLGAGSIGQRHLRNLLALGHSPVAVFDPDPKSFDRIRHMASGSIFTSDESAVFKNPADAVLICSPTDHHIRQARLAIERGLHAFIEKPVSHSLEGTQTLITQTSQSLPSVLVACNLRFLPSLKLVERLLNEGRIGRPLSVRAHYGYYLPFWRPSVDYRGGYGAKEGSGGIILDCIHEFDYLCWLMGDIVEIFCYANKLSRLEIESEDTASMVFRFSSGGIGSLHLDYLQRTYRRSCDFIGEDGVIVWDYISQNVTVYDKHDRHCEVFQESINTEINQMFVDEMVHFVNCVQNREKPLVNLPKALVPLKIALAARQSASEGRAVRIES